MIGHDGRKELSSRNLGLSWVGFLFGEPSNKPLQRTVACGARR